MLSSSRGIRSWRRGEHYDWQRFERYLVLWFSERYPNCKDRIHHWRLPWRSAELDWFHALVWKDGAYHFTFQLLKQLLKSYRPKISSESPYEESNRGHFRHRLWLWSTQRHYFNRRGTTWSWSEESNRGNIRHYPLLWLSQLPYSNQSDRTRSQGKATWHLECHILYIGINDDFVWKRDSGILLMCIFIDPLSWPTPLLTLRHSFCGKDGLIHVHPVIRYIS